MEPPRSCVVEELGPVIQEIKRELSARIPHLSRKEFVKLMAVWHPDKNPLLQGLAAEVSKMINAELEDLER